MLLLKGVWHIVVVNEPCVIFESKDGAYESLSVETTINSESNVNGMIFSSKASGKLFHIYFGRNGDQKIQTIISNL